MTDRNPILHPFTPQLIENRRAQTFACAPLGLACLSRNESRCSTTKRFRNVTDMTRIEGAETFPTQEEADENLEAFTNNVIRGNASYILFEKLVEIQTKLEKRLDILEAKIDSMPGGKEYYKAMKRFNSKR